MKKSKVKSRKFKALLFAAFLSTFNSQLSTAWAQQAQAQQGQPLYAVNAKYVQGVGPGYWPTAGAGLTLNIAAGTAICGNPPVKVDYAGGTLTMTNAATNYVYLDPTASCAPASKTTGFTVGMIPLAQVVAAGGVITGVTDVRTWFVDPNSLGPVIRADLMPGADIGAKVNAAIAASSGGVIEIPAGSYTYTTPIVLNKANIWLRGHAGGTSLTFNGGAGTYAITLGDASPSTVTKLWVTSLKITGNGSAKGIRVRRGVSINTVIQSNQLSGFVTNIEWGEGTSSAFDGVIRDNQISLDSAQIGIDLIYRAHSLTIDDNWIRDYHSAANTTIGIKVSGESTGVRIVHNNIEGCPGGNIVLAGALSYATLIAGNYFESYGTGYDIIVGDDVIGTIIRDNYSNAINGTGGYQIRLTDGAVYTHILENTFLNATTAMVKNEYTGTSRHIFIEGNETAGVTLIDSSTGLAQVTDHAGSLGIGMIPSRSLDITPTTTGYGARIRRMGTGAGNGLAWGWSIENAYAADNAALAETSSAYTTGGALGWAGNSKTILYYPAEFRIGTGTGATPTMVMSAGNNVGIGKTPGTNAQVDVAKSIASGVNTVTFSATPTFDASLGNTQKITLTANVTSSTLSNATAGQTINFLICQDGTGSRTFVWPTNVKGGMTIGSTLSTCSAQDFIFDGTNAYALSAGVTNM